MTKTHHLYCQVIELHSKIAAIETKLRTILQADTIDSYLNHALAILENYSEFLDQVLTQHNALWQEIEIECNNLPALQRELVILKRQEFNFKLERKIQYLQTLQNARLAQNDYNNEFDVILDKTKILNFLPSPLADQMADDLFSHLAVICQNDAHFSFILQQAGKQKNETPLFWQKFARHFAPKGWMVFKHPNIAMAEQNGPTCLPVTLGLAYAYAHQLVAHQVPHYLAFIGDPTMPLILRPLSNEHTLHAIRATQHMSDETFTQSSLRYAREDFYLAQAYGLGPLELKKDLRARTKTIINALHHYGPIVWGRRSHAVLITGYAKLRDQKKVWLLVTDPELPGRTMLEKGETLKATAPLLCKEKIPELVRQDRRYFSAFVINKEKVRSQSPFIPNPAYDPNWAPGDRMHYSSPYHGATEFQQIELKSQATPSYVSWFKHHYIEKIEGDAWWQGHPISPNTEDRLTYGKIVNAARNASSLLDHPFIKEKLPLFQDLYQQMLDDQMPYDEDPIFALRWRLIIEATAQGDKDKILDISYIASEELIQKYASHIPVLFPKLRDLHLGTQPIIPTQAISDNILPSTPTVNGVYKAFE